MKIWINYEFKDHAWGGGNQFLKALANEWAKAGLLAATPHDADAILFNSHHDILDVICLKKRYPTKAFVHRVDGPEIIWREGDNSVDEFVFQINQLVADATVFQSSWSRYACLQMGLKPSPHETVILNAPDKTKFFPKKFATDHSSEIIKLVATGWARSENKGFEVYEWLDQTLCKHRFSFTYIGRVNQKFQISNVIGPVDSHKLGELLRQQDIYITASRNDPCSNSLIEAMHCGLPAVALNSGGHPEIVKKGGLLFNTKEEVPTILEKMCSDIDSYRSAIDLPSIEETAKSYADFMSQVVREQRTLSTGTFDVRRALSLIDQHHDRSKFRPWKKIRRRLKLAFA